MAVLPILGIIFMMLLALHIAGPKIPVLNRRLSDWYGAQLTRYLGGMLILIQDADGHWTLAPAEYDSENNGYWAAQSTGYEFYDAEGAGGNPGTFYGASLVAAYQGLGGVTDLVSGEIGRQAGIKKRRTDEEDLRDGKLEGAKKKIMGKNWKEAFGGVTDINPLGNDSDAEAEPDAEPVTDGGGNAYAAEMAEKDLEEELDKIDEFDALLPEKKVVDLRDTLYNAPFHVRPEAFHRVEKNAQKGVSGFGSLGAVGQASLIMGAMFLGGILVWFVMGNSGGGSMTLPFTLAPMFGF